MTQITHLPKVGYKNAIFTIFPYKVQGAWVFDDEKVGLVREAFVAGADSLLDILTQEADSCALLFSQNEFPGYDIKITLKATQASGSDYYCEALGHDLWLCPALFLYYPKAPQSIYIKIKQ